MEPHRTFEIYANDALPVRHRKIESSDVVVVGEGGGAEPLVA
jgi:hypothetical protein